MRILASFFYVNKSVGDRGNRIFLFILKTEADFRHFFLFLTHADCAVKNLHVLHAEHALTKSKRVKILKILFKNLHTG